MSGSSALGHGINNVAITAQWRTSKSFGVSSIEMDAFSPSSAIHKETVVKQTNTKTP